MSDTLPSMTGLHRRTPRQDLHAAYNAITERPIRPDREYRILAALKIPVAPPAVRAVLPLRGQHFCFFAAREPRWKTWVCEGGDLVPLNGPAWYDAVQEAELALNIEAWVWNMARDALWRLIHDLGGTSDWDYGNYTYIDQPTYFVHLPSSNAKTPEHEFAHGMSFTVFTGALEALLRACAPRGWSTPSPPPLSKGDTARVEFVAPPSVSPGGDPRPLAGYKRRTASSPVPPKGRMYPSSPVPSLPPLEVYAEYGFGGLVEHVEREIEDEKSDNDGDDNDNGDNSNDNNDENNNDNDVVNDDGDDDWETVDDGSGSPAGNIEEDERYSGCQTQLVRQLSPDLGDSETHPNDEHEAEASGETYTIEQGDHDDDDELPTAYGYERLDSETSSSDGYRSNDGFEPYVYDPDVDNTDKVLEDLAGYIKAVKLALEQYGELEVTPSTDAQSDMRSSEEERGVDEMHRRGGAAGEGRMGSGMGRDELEDRHDGEHRDEGGQESMRDEERAESVRHADYAQLDSDPMDSNVGSGCAPKGEDNDDMGGIEEEQEQAKGEEEDDGGHDGRDRRDEDSAITVSAKQKVLEVKGSAPTRSSGGPDDDEGNLPVWSTGMPTGGAAGGEQEDVIMHEPLD